ncbi:hypothetical protein GOV04_02375 [Candidatus Woesearchaeota archaeon]|nr:hypothetical protein [Candidatus Woesearchaeota archaeon]
MAGDDDMGNKLVNIILVVGILFFVFIVVAKLYAAVTPHPDKTSLDNRDAVVQVIESMKEDLQSCDSGQASTCTKEISQPMQWSKDYKLWFIDKNNAIIVTLSECKKQSCLCLTDDTRYFCEPLDDIIMPANPTSLHSSGNIDALNLKMGKTSDGYSLEIERVETPELFDPTVIAP